MDDSRLTLLSLVVALLGIGSLFAIAQLLEPETPRIAEISDADSGKIVRVEGSLGSVSENDGHYFLTVNDGSKIKAVIFESKARNMPGLEELEKGQQVSVTGQVAMYKGEVEIIVQALNVLSN